MEYFYNNFKPIVAILLLVLFLARVLISMYFDIFGSDDSKERFSMKFYFGESGFDDKDNKIIQNMNAKIFLIYPVFIIFCVAGIVFFIFTLKS